MKVEEEEDNDDDNLVLEHRATCFKIFTYTIIRKIINPHVPIVQLVRSSYLNINITAMLSSQLKS